MALRNITRSVITLVENASTAENTQLGGFQNAQNAAAPRETLGDIPMPAGEIATKARKRGQAALIFDALLKRKVEKTT
jgi:hypothetical protein